jgi:transposase
MLQKSTVRSLEPVSASLMLKRLSAYPNQITSWKAQLLEGAAGVFGSGPAGIEAAPAVDVKVLHAKIGELTLEVDFWPVRSVKPGC